MPKYRVIARQIVYEFAKVEAESPEEAKKLVEGGYIDPQWNFMDYGAWRVDDVEEMENA
jgi:hypothetical protein